MSLYWAKNRNMIPMMIRATPIATEDDPPPLSAIASPANRFSLILLLLEHSSVFHHKVHVFKRINVGQWIALHCNHIGIRSRRNHAQFAFHVQKFSSG